MESQSGYVDSLRCWGGFVSMLLSVFLHHRVSPTPTLIGDLTEKSSITYDTAHWKKKVEITGPGRNASN